MSQPNGESIESYTHHCKLKKIEGKLNIKFICKYLLVHEADCRVIFLDKSIRNIVSILIELFG